MLDKLYELKEVIISKKYILLFLIILAGIISLFIYSNSYEKNDMKEYKVPLVKEEPKKIEKEIKNIKVDIKGYVNNPGLYEVDIDSRVMDVINLAGGLVPESDTTVINLGKKVFDEMVIYIYSKNDVKNFIKIKEEEQEKDEKCIVESNVKNDACITKEQRLENTVTISNIPSDNNKIDKKENNKISLNNATKEELMNLTGIGESKALAIIKYREENSGFKTIEEIMNISGIGEKLFAKIKDSITL